MNLTPAQQSMRDMWLAEMWRPVPEVPFGDRQEQRKRDRMQQRALEERRAQVPHRPSTTCAETGGQEPIERPA